MWFILIFACPIIAVLFLFFEWSFEVLLVHLFFIGISTTYSISHVVLL